MEPYELAPDAAVSLATAAFVAMLGFLAYRYTGPRSPHHDPARAAVVVTLLACWLLLLLAGIGGLYPFGGKARHQYVLYPFLAVVLTLAIDEIYGVLSAQRVRAAFSIAVPLVTNRTSCGFAIMSGMVSSTKAVPARLETTSAVVIHRSFGHGRCGDRLAAATTASRIGVNLTAVRSQAVSAT